MIAKGAYDGSDEEIEQDEGKNQEHGGGECTLQCTQYQGQQENQEKHDSRQTGFKDQSHYAANSDDRSGDHLRLRSQDGKRLFPMGLEQQAKIEDQPGYGGINGVDDSLFGFL